MKKTTLAIVAGLVVLLVFGAAMAAFSPAPLTAMGSSVVSAVQVQPTPLSPDLTENITVNEIITVSDSPQVFPPVFLTVNESISVSDSPQGTSTHIPDG